MVRFSLAVFLALLVVANGAVSQEVKKPLPRMIGEKNLLEEGRWGPWQDGFQREGAAFVCDNGDDATLRKGVGQTVVLNQKKPAPLIASVFSKAENASGAPSADYSLYLDLTFTDGSHQWGLCKSFPTGTHDWVYREITVVPSKPIRSLSYWLLFRGRRGKVAFRDAKLRAFSVDQSATLFHGAPVVLGETPRRGFQVRDVAADSGFHVISSKTLGLKLDVAKTNKGGKTYYDVTLADTTGKDRAVTLVYAIHAPAQRWLNDPRQSAEPIPQGEMANTRHYPAGSIEQLSWYPFGAVVSEGKGIGLGIDMAQPAFFRIAYNGTTEELYLAYDIGLAPEKNRAKVRFCEFSFDPAWEFRGVLSAYYAAFPEAFVRRIARQGLWMPFAKISQVEGWPDFGFRFKEGTNETGWDDAHDILTFRYTEPMTWWMRMDKKLPRTHEAALAEAQRLAEKGDRRAKALFASGMRDADGKLVAYLRDTPWCNGAVWSMNSLPGIGGEFTDFANKWTASNPDSRYAKDAQPAVDGEYIDSSEGYVTATLDFHRDHFRIAETPLCFDPDTHRPGILRGLVAFEYIRAIERDVHGRGKLMMANSTPHRLCWLLPLLDVAGTETDWNHGNRWTPWSSEHLLYRRALCKAKPYCFLMNSNFENFSHEMVEKYMKRSLAFGMFPGFFSADASTKHYFDDPKLYNRDRGLFKKYVPLCQRVAEAGWEPIPLARADHSDIDVERFGRRYITVFNEGASPAEFVIRLEGLEATRCEDLVRAKTLPVQNGTIRLKLDSEDVALLDLKPGK